MPVEVLVEVLVPVPLALECMPAPEVLLVPPVDIALDPELALVAPMPPVVSVMSPVGVVAGAEGAIEEGAAF